MPARKHGRNHDRFASRAANAVSASDDVADDLVAEHERPRVLGRNGTVGKAQVSVTKPAREHLDQRFARAWIRHLEIAADQGRSGTVNEVREPGAGHWGCRLRR